MITDLKINETLKQEYYDKGYWSDETMLDAWNARVASFADKLYVKDDKGSAFTYGEVDDAAARLASWLVSVGVKPGDVVTFQIPTWAEFCVVYVAVLKAGAVMHPVAKNFNAADLPYIMNQVGCTAFICPTFHHKTDYEAQILSLVDEVPSLPRSAIALIDKQAPAKTDLVTLSSILGSFEPLEHDVASGADDAVCILSTSGTTGKPKAALLTHNSILFSERTFTRMLHRDEHDIMFMPSPLNHATGFFHGLISPMILGGTTVLQEHFEPAAAIELCNAEGVTWSMGATPFIFDLLNTLDATGKHLESLRLFLSGGAPLPSSLIQRAHTHDVLLCEVYGSTESCPHILVPPELCLEWNGAWSGIAPAGIEVMVVDAQGNEVPRGTQGEELSRGPHMFAGYLNNPEATEKSLTDDGWFFSGDLCYMDDEGRVRINGRKKEIIIRGGENISAREVDENVLGFPEIADLATIGAPDERLGERICLFAVPEEGLDHELCLHDICAYLDERGISKRLWPERLEVTDAIPRTPTGKVQRYLLAEELKSRMEERQA